MIMGYLVMAVVGIVVGCLAMLVILMPGQKKAEELSRRGEEQLTVGKKMQEAAQQKSAELAGRELQVSKRESVVISFEEIERENQLLKRDLQNVDVNLNKLRMDVELQEERQRQLEIRSQEVGRRYLSETAKAVMSSVNAHNFAACKERLLTVIERVRSIGFDVPVSEERRLLSELQTEFEMAVRAAVEREEQARIRARIREEAQVERERERELKQAERERLAVQAALDQALAAAAGKHSEEIERLQAKLAEAEEKARRTLSMAEQTKAGNVYVISNIGAFGEGVFKVGMTRRLAPLDRIRELGDASVPFPFDVHMMIACDDAPALENALHRALHVNRLNKVNPRKEFFRADIEAIREVVKQHHGCDVKFVADPEALEYRQSQSMKPEDAEFIEHVFEEAEEEIELRDGGAASE